VAVALLAASAAPAAASPAPATPAGPPSLDADAWLLIDADDEQRLAARAPSRPLAIASATKLMTAYLALEELPLKRKLMAPAYQALPAESILGLREGERVSVRDLLYSLILASANDSAVTIAQGAAGSVEAFVEEMNDAAQQLGLNDTSYTNPIGLDDPGNRSSARDLVTLADELMENKLFRRIADSTEATIHTDQRTIEVMTRDTLLLSDPSVNGIKTGHTLDAGYVLVGSATREGVDLISVVLGAPSEAARDSETEQLLDYGFSLYRPRTPVREGEAIAHPELAYQDQTLGLAAARTLRVSVRRGQQLATEVDAPEEVVGPIEKGERLGTVSVSVDGSEVDSAPLVATRAAEAATFTQKLRSRFPVAAAVAVVAFVVILIVVVLVRRRSGAPRTTEERMRSREERRRKGDESP
jgi:serine-type D-Ala-D-Ala carboxypeptidase (penicillin-binding protein 5/6)